MKKLSRIIGVIFAFAMIFIVTGCGKEGKNTKIDDTQKVKSNCKYYECLSKLSVKDTKDEITKKIGITPKDIDDKKYEYDFGDDKKITVNTTEAGKILTISIEYDKKVLKNKNVTLKNLNDIKARINTGITYDEFKESVGGVDGTLYQVGSWNKYVWVCEDGHSNVTASFGSDGKLKFFSGIGF